MSRRLLFEQFLRRLGVWLAVLALSGLLAATLVRIAPGFGTDERLLDPRLSAASQEAIGKERTAERNVLRFYADYLGQLARGDLGTSLALNRPVTELLAERAGVSARSVGEFAEADGIDGALVGGASLDPDEFAAVVRAFA